MKKFELLCEEIKQSLQLTRGDCKISFSSPLTKERLDKVYQLMGENNIIVYENSKNTITVLCSSVEKALSVLRNKNNEDVKVFKLFNCKKG